MDYFLVNFKLFEKQPADQQFCTPHKSEIFNVWLNSSTIASFDDSLFSPTELFYFLPNLTE